MKLLDLFCGAGGCSEGYRRAGFEVVGVDIAPQPRYPFRFVRADAIEYLEAHGHEYDAIHASPPCQGYSRLRHVPGRDMRAYPKLVEPVRNALEKIDKPYVIENVPDSGLRTTVILCGLMFGLKVYRHRHFETNFMVLQPAHIGHSGTIRRGKTGKLATYSGELGAMTTVAGHMFSRASGSVAMGIDWMTRDELAEAIPPAYTEYIGGFLKQVLATRPGAAGREKELGR